MPLIKKLTKSLIEVPEGFICDHCKKQTEFDHFKVYDFNNTSCYPDYIPIDYCFGYGSQHDGEKVSLSICEPCFENYCVSIGVISCLDKSQIIKPGEKSILYIDMDDTICDFKTAWHKRRKVSTSIKYPQSKEGFFLGLEPIAQAIKSVNMLRQHFDTYILTAPSYKNPLCYTEKRLWIEQYFDVDFCKKLIICAHKNLLIGDYLIDDNASGKGQENFQGTLIQFGTSKHPDWQSVVSQLLSQAKTEGDTV